ncbi:hypothetical protein EDB89DRAFT_2240336 [Lactarius sanguifluus]|nr:hypothetical protein EDB89DRAFT_2240336 [Lactarius sanguifluus]
MTHGRPLGRPYKLSGAMPSESMLITSRVRGKLPKRGMTSCLRCCKSRADKVAALIKKTSTITTKVVLSPIVPKYNVHDPYLNASTTVTRTVDGLDERSVRATVLHGAAAYVQSNNVTQASLCQIDFYDTFRAGADVVITVTADSCGASVPQSISTGGLATTR